MQRSSVALRSIWLSAETEAPGQWNPTDDAVDVEVTLTDGSRWGGTFVTYRYLETLRARYANSGECLSGRYFWAANLVLCDLVDRPTIEAVVADLLATGELQSALELLEGSRPAAQPLTTEDASPNPSLQRTLPGRSPGQRR